MIKDMIVSSTALETRVAILEDDQLAELYIERHRSRGILANTYKGKVTKVLPGMQSAFVNIGLEKDAFLYVSDFVEENEEIDTYILQDDEPLDIAMEVVEAEIPMAEARPQRREKDRERKGEKSRWREKKERAASARTGGAGVSVEEISEIPVDSCDDETQIDEAQFDAASSKIISETGEASFNTSATFESSKIRETPDEPLEAVAENVVFPEAFADAPNATIGAEDEHAATETAESCHAAREEPEVLPDEPAAVEIAANESASNDSVIAETPDTSEQAAGISETASVDAASTADPSDANETGDSENETSEYRHKLSAAIRDDGELMQFSGDDGERGGYARRRGVVTRRKRYTAAHSTSHPAHKPPERHSIDDMLREGQEVLVQVAKEPIGKKGARVTSHIALPGRYLVYMPTVDHVGVSRKIGSDAERMRLKDIILRHREQFPGGVIVRTAAAEHSEDDLVNDLRFLVRIWEDMRARADRVSAPALIHAEMSLVQRLLRDQFSFEFASIRVDDEYEYQRIVEFVDKIYPNLVHRVKLYTKENSIFDEYGITHEIDKLLHSKIWLKSGGYIVINQTEALVSIDINTGKFVGRGNSLEETITRTNLEAVKEIVRQIRLRDLGGIIVIDFIDMDERKNRKRVMEALSEEIAHDKAPNKILEFNEFGLVAITRKRVKQSLERTLCQPCPYCSGSGMVKSISTTCHSIFHEVEKMRGMIDDRMELTIRVHPDVARALRETESNVIEELRHIMRRDVIVKADPALHIEHFNIVT
jgi:ribonuclease G